MANLTSSFSLQQYQKDDIRRYLERDAKDQAIDNSPSHLAAVRRFTEAVEAEASINSISGSEKR